jgi:hypothetical protein
VAEIPELSVPLAAGSLGLPVLKAAETPPTVEATPVPTDGVSVPVPTPESGGMVLKSHCEMTAAGAFVAAARTRRDKIMFFINLGNLSNLHNFHVDLELGTA